MVDIVQLGYEVDTAQVLKGEAALDQLTTSTMNADRASKTLARTSATGNAGLRTAAVHATAAGRAMQGSSMQTANLAAQLNDIGVMLAAGQSPLLLAVQQGTQINQVFAQMGGGLTALRGIGAAALSIVNPMSLATIGIIAGGAALAQWGIRALSAGESSEGFAEAMADLAESTKEARIEIERISLGLDNTEQALAARGIAEARAQMAVLNAELEEYRSQVSGPENLSVFAGQIAALERQLEVQREIVRSAEEAIEANRRANEELALIEEAGRWAEELADITRERQKIEADARRDAEALLATLQREVALNSMILQFGEDSLVVARLRAQQEREVFVQQTQSRNISEELKKELIAAYDAATGIAGTDMATAIANAADEAARLRQNLQIGATGFGNDLTQLPGEGANAAVADQRVEQLRNAWREANQPARSARSGGGASDPFGDNLNTLIQSLETERETLDRFYFENLAILEDRRAMEILGEEAHKQALLRLEQDYVDQIRQINQQAADDRLGQYANLFGALQGVAQAGGDGLIKAAAVFGGIEATINAYRAAAQALADPSVPFFAKAAAYASVLGTGLGAVKAIRQAGGVGGGSGGASGVSAAAPAQQTLETLRIEILGDNIGADLFESILSEAQSRNRNGVNLEVVRR